MLLSRLRERIMGDYVIDPRHDIKLYTILVRDSFIPLTLILAASLTVVIFISRTAAGIPFPPVTFTVYILIFSILPIIYKKYPMQGLFRLFIFLIIFATFLLTVISKNNPLNEFIIILLFPVLAYHLAGRKTGSIWIIFFSIYALSIITLVSLRIIESSYSPVTLMTGFSLFVYIAILSYYAELRHGNIERLLMHQLYYDSITGLPSRKMLMEDIPLTLYPSMIILRVDNFHDINTFFGYNLGDSLLKFIGDRISQYRGDYKLKIYNLTGGEFAVLVKMGERTLPDNSEITTIAGEMLKHITEKEFIHNDIKIPLTAYAGISPSSEGSDNIISKADIALHHAIKKRMPIHIFHEKDMDMSIYLDNMKKLAQLNDAIAENRLIPYFQPIMNNQSGKISRYESLMRIIDNKGNPQSPGPYLEIAKKTQLYPEMTKIIFEKTFAYMQNKVTDFALNISADDIYYPGFLRFLEDILDRYPSAKGRVFLEIVESEKFNDYNFLADFILQAKKAGLYFGIDDFGSGYSNFSYLNRLHLDFIKFDGSLIKKIDSDKSSRIIVRNIAMLCRELGIITVAEFVSNENILNMIKEYRIDYSQGFYIGEPAPSIRE